MDTNNKNYLLKKEGYKLIGAAFEVYNEIGGGLLEEVYQQALEIELGLRNIEFDSKRQLNIYYKSRKLEKVYIPDLIVYNGIIVELKSVKEIFKEHEAQLMNYLRITKLNVGYIINFGNTEKLDWKRYILTK